MIPNLGPKKGKVVSRRMSGHSYSSVFSQRDNGKRKRMNFKAMMRKQELERLKKQVYT